MPQITQIKPKNSDVIYDVVDKVSNYTAFEVMPNKVEIAAGTSTDIVKEYDESNNPVYYTYTVSVPACTIHKMRIRSLQAPEECDVVIDWGDGTVDSIMDGNYVSYSEGSGFKVEHDYSTAMTEDIQRFVVKIYGKDYWAFRHNEDPENNLICRIFDVDLPAATHIGNFASTAIYSKRLIKVKFPKATKPYSDVWNWSSTFSKCTNLKEVIGFDDISMRDDATVQQIFLYSTALETTDLVLPAGTNNIYEPFHGCRSLTGSVSDFLPKNGFKSANVSVFNAFTYCPVLELGIAADLLWNDKKIDWSIKSTTYKPFNLCSDELRSQVPVSWGGTSASEEARLNIKDFNYYSAFEVMPNKVEIAAGTATDIVKEYDESNNPVYYTYSVGVSASTVHKMRIRSLQAPEECDVVIDWGDGTVDSIREGNYTDYSEGSGFKVEHDYAPSMTEDIQRFVVKIYGKDYWAFRHNEDPENNLICRIFDVDLPTADHIGNFASMVRNSNRLIKVQFPKSTKPYADVWNWSYTFSICKNLKEVVGFEDISIRDDALVNQIFIHDTALEKTDLVLPAGSNFLFEPFHTCSSLEGAVSDFLPKRGFKSSNISVKNLFTLCSKLTLGTAADLLWNDRKIAWSNTSASFSSCSVELRAQVPVSWGGTASNDIIAKSPDEKIQELSETIAQLTTRLEALENA